MYDVRVVHRACIVHRHIRAVGCGSLYDARTTSLPQPGRCARILTPMCAAKAAFLSVFLPGDKIRLFGTIGRSFATLLTPHGNGLLEKPAAT